MVLLCFVFSQEIGSCLVDLIERKPPPVPKTFKVFAALEYQHDVLLKEAGLCPSITYEKLKKITLESGAELRILVRVP